MAHPLDIRVTAPFDLGDVVARLDLAGAGPRLVVLRDGRFQGSADAPVTHLTLTPSGAPAGEAPLRLPDPDLAGSPEGPAVPAAELFDHGIAIPPDGVLHVQIAWGMPCHAAVVHTDSGEPTRFGSWEHILTAEKVGLDAAGERLLPQLAFDATTALEVGGKKLAFGEIIALAGDFYAHLDDVAKRDFEDAWPPMGGVAGWVAGDYRGTTLAGDAESGPKDILEIVRRDKDVDRGAAGEFAQLALDVTKTSFPARRYLALASQNWCHFGSQPWDGSVDDGANEALALYRRYHTRALRAAEMASTDSIRWREGLLAALVADAFGCHFLTDLFASGHIRVPRRVLGQRYGIFRGALGMSHSMHAEDNERGLWCRPRVAQPHLPGLVWRAYGDGMLRKDHARPHRDLVTEAVRRSVEEVLAAFEGRTLAADARAEALLPVPQPPRFVPGPNDLLPDGRRAPAEQPNHFPLYRVEGGAVQKRIGPDPHEGVYQDVDGPIR